MNDKRHGHGVLKVLGKYAYYGQWDKNTRTGHGVLVNEDGTKEEGEWHNGTRVAIVKRHKVLLFKSHQLEQKVKEAHTKSLQAAEKARSKAELAISRASTAVNRSELAAGVAEKARVDAREAITKAEHYKNAPTVSGKYVYMYATQTAFNYYPCPLSMFPTCSQCCIDVPLCIFSSEAAKTPVAGPTDFNFPSIDSTHSVTGPFPTGSSMDSSLLAVSQPIVPSTSFDNIGALSDSGRGLGSDSPGILSKDPVHMLYTPIATKHGNSISVFKLILQYAR